MTKNHTGKNSNLGILSPETAAVVPASPTQTSIEQVHAKYNSLLKTKLRDALVLPNFIFFVTPLC